MNDTRDLLHTCHHQQEVGGHTCEISGCCVAFSPLEGVRRVLLKITRSKKKEKEGQLELGVGVAAKNTSSSPDKDLEERIEFEDRRLSRRQDVVAEYLRVSKATAV